QLTAAVCNEFASALRESPAMFHQALLRDHARCVAEFAQRLGINDGDQLTQLLDGLRSPWPLTLPSDEEVSRWHTLPKLADSCLGDDFFTYSLNCLREWAEGMPKPTMARWVLMHVARDMHYEGSGCEEYDSYMLGKYGGGRGRQKWADR